jgi:hypothetical protein
LQRHHIAHRQIYANIDQIPLNKALLLQISLEIWLVTSIIWTRIVWSNPTFTAKSRSLFISFHSYYRNRDFYEKKSLQQLHQ